jgi:hypothetical protein
MNKHKDYSLWEGSETPMEGELWDRYQVYLRNNTEDYDKTFDEWLNS